MNYAVSRCCRTAVAIGGLSLAAALIPGATLAAPGTPVGSPFDIGNSANGASVARAPDGHFAVLWCEMDTANTGACTSHVQVFDATATAVAGDITLGAVGADAVNPQYGSIVADGNGNFDLLEREQTNATATAGLSLNVVRVGADGSLLGTPIAITSVPAPGKQRLTLNARLSADGSGNFVVAWRYKLSVAFGSGPGAFTVTTSAAYAKTYDAAGSAIAGPFAVLAPSKGYTLGLGQAAYLPEDLSVAMSGNGNVAFAWTSRKSSLFFSTAPNASNGVYAQLFGKDGTPQVPAFRVSDTSQTYPDNIGYTPEVAADDAGNFVVTWTYYPKGSSTANAYAQRYDASANAVGSPITLAENVVQTVRDVKFDSLGHFLIVWSAASSDGPLELNGQFYNTADGSALGSPFEFAKQPAAVTGYAGEAADIDAAGEPVAVWSWYESQGTGLPLIFHAKGQLYTGP